jgi:hypothetical protein
VIADIAVIWQGHYNILISTGCFFKQPKGLDAG